MSRCLLPRSVVRISWWGAADLLYFERQTAAAKSACEDAKAQLHSNDGQPAGPVDKVAVYNQIAKVKERIKEFQEHLAATTASIARVQAEASISANGTAGNSFGGVYLRTGDWFRQQ